MTEAMDEEEKAMAAKATTQKMEAIVHENHLRDEEQKAAQMQEAMRKIKDATGVTDTDDVIAKFNTQEETRTNLIAMSNEAEARIEALNQQLAAARKQLDEVKFQSGTGNQGTRRVIEEFEGQVSTNTLLCERNKAKYERLAAILIDVKAGVGHLSEKLACIKLEQAAIEMSDQTVTDVLQQCHDKLDRLMKQPELTTVLANPEKLAELQADKATDAPKPGEESKEGDDMPEFNVRIRMPNVDGEEVDLDDDEEEEESEEEEDMVFDRLKIKQNSQSFVDRLGKKNKRRRGPKGKGK